MHARGAWKANFGRRFVPSFGSGALASFSLLEWLSYVLFRCACAAYALLHSRAACPSPSLRTVPQPCTV